MKKIFSSLSQIFILFLLFSSLSNNIYASSENDSNQATDISNNNSKKSKGLSNYFKGSKAANVKIIRLNDDDEPYSSNTASNSAVNQTKNNSSASKENQTSSYATLPNGKAYIGVTSYLSLRDEPFGKVLVRLYNNEEIFIVNRDGDWYEVETEKGSGWVYGKCIFASQNSKPSSSVLNPDDEEDKEEVDDDNNIIVSKGNGTYNYFTFTEPGDYNISFYTTSNTSTPLYTSTSTSTSTSKSTSTSTSKSTSTSTSVKNSQKTKTTKSKKSTNSKKKTKTTNSNKSVANKSSSNDKTSSKTSTNNTNLKPLLKLSKVNVSTVLTKTVGNTWDEKGHNYTHIQGFCTDGEYWYIALMTSTNGDGEYYTKQETKLLKINIKTKKVVKTNKIGKVGHSNSLTYNPNTKKIYSATCTKKMSYIYSFNASDLKGKTKIKLKNKKGQTINNYNFASFSFNPAQNEYIVKLSNKTLGYFDSNFTLKKKVSVKHMKKNDKMTGQAITCDGCNIFSVYNNLSSNPRINYIRIYDMDGKYIKDLTFKSSIGTASEKPEMEQLTCYNGEYWSLSNVNGKFRIHKIKLRG